LPGIENYSRHLTGRQPGEPPPTLLSYFPSDFLLVIDESHVTVPQIGGMYRGDRSRKGNLRSNTGFACLRALDNRPLNFEGIRGDDPSNDLRLGDRRRFRAARKATAQVIEQGDSPHRFDGSGDHRASARSPGRRSLGRDPQDGSSAKRRVLVNDSDQAHVPRILPSITRILTSKFATALGTLKL
jgi:hypothetical protein